MLGELASLMRDALGIGADEIGVGEMVLRALLVFPVAIVFVRVGAKRFLGELSAFDLVVAIMLGSILSRAITGNSPFLPTLAAGLALVLLHRMLAKIAVTHQHIGVWIKGRERLLVEDGEIRWTEMKESGIGEADLMAALRRNAQLTEVGAVKAAYLERTGDISVIPRDAGG